VYFTTPATLLTSLSAQLPYLLLAFFFTEETVGLFGRGHKLLALPAALIAGAFAKIFMVDAAEAQRAGRLAISVQDVFNRMIAFGFFPTLVAIIAGPEIFSFLLGQDWVTAGIFAGYLAPWIFLTVVSSNLTPIFDVTNNQSADFKSGLIILSVQAAALYWGSLSGVPLIAVLYMVIAGCLLRILHVIWLFHLSNTPLRLLLESPAKQFVVSLPGIALVIASQVTGMVFLVLLAAILGWGLNFYLNARFFAGTNPRS
jgi:O-antigen/teichoic acid export membrane protein